MKLECILIQKQAHNTRWTGKPFLESCFDADKTTSVLQVYDKRVIRELYLSFSDAELQTGSL
jgi:hypothetical protein